MCFQMLVAQKRDLPARIPEMPLSRPDPATLPSILEGQNRQVSLRIYMDFGRQLARSQIACRTFHFFEYLAKEEYASCMHVANDVVVQVLGRVESEATAIDGSNRDGPT